jgi:hypothetical protein
MAKKQQLGDMFIGGKKDDKTPPSYYKSNGKPVKDLMFGRVSKTKRK